MEYIKNCPRGGKAQGEDVLISTQLYTNSLPPDCIPRPQQSGQPDPDPCVPPFTAGTYGCYHGDTTPVNFAAAQTLCSGHGGQVLELSGEEIAELRFSFIRPDPDLARVLFTTPGFWIGATDQAVEGSWLWVTSGKPLPSFLGPPYMDRWGGGRCAAFAEYTGSSELRQMECNETLGVLCEIGKNRSHINL